MNALSPFLARILAVVIAWGATQLGARYGIVVDSAAQAALVEHSANIIAIFIGIYAVSHKTLNKWLNPGDAASSHLAASESAETDRLKRINS